MEHKYQKCWVQQQVYDKLGGKEQLVASVSIDLVYLFEN